ncbi:ferritin-like domain-containing protein [Nocardioides daeguensis]|uniref:DUF4439 domain-containing protein n=1 Tax=Nocardioides daeguensis TaxID=908359 RepID=A0ABP6UXH6_9ACTN|nr:ferritin-like domain-containing protein [Nocardioides daeguensis]MBV6725813.1 ferritin-like domain-containing protein [Nocardioides daeguensis]MCR1772672.1 ferritin-like domain-containing protein [Nocardioides daeguensis]
MPVRPRPVSRRLVLGGGIGVATLALSGCDVLDDVLGSDDDPGVSGAVTPTAPPADADSALVEGVLAEISTTGGLAAATAAADPGHRAAARLARIHRIHATELGGTVASAAPGAVAPADPQALLSAEGALQQQLVDAARKADSGGLAQVLASMAAALGQALVGRNTSAPASLPAAAGDTGPAVAALQTTLAAEHAAVFVYGALGGQTSRSGSPVLYDAVTSAYTTHRSRRDELTARLTAAGADPVAAEPGYGLPADLGTPAAVRARAQELEESAATTYAYLVANTNADARAWAIDACIDAAVRAVAFGARPDPLPGL